MKKSEDLRERSGQATSLKKPSDSVSSAAPTCLRRLKWDELVTHGDFIEDKIHGFELWEGPTGFRADAFVMPIYRRDKTSPAAPKKIKQPVPASLRPKLNGAIEEFTETRKIQDLATSKRR